MAKEWGPFQTWVERIGGRAVLALRNLHQSIVGDGKGTKEGKVLRAAHFRCLRGLYTDEAFEVVATAMMVPGTTVDAVSKAAEGAHHEQWVSWVWRPENPKLHRDVGMPSRSLVPVVASFGLTRQRCTALPFFTRITWGGGRVRMEGLCLHATRRAQLRTHTLRTPTFPQ